ncbi:MAG: VTT domain-containing protein, partial [Acidobacteriota bacterium]
MSSLEDFLAFALALSPTAVLLLVFLSAWLEFVFPPYFGDSIMLFGFFLAGQGAVPAVEVFVAAAAGSILGSVLAFALGYRYGSVALDKLSRWRRRGQGPPESLQRLLQQNGEAILLVNRFLPFLRNFMLYGAGAMRLRFVPAMVANALSVLAFVSFLMALGLMAAGSFEELRDSFRQLYGWGGALALAAV